MHAMHRQETLPQEQDTPTSGSRSRNSSSRTKSCCVLIFLQSTYIHVSDDARAMCLNKVGRNAEYNSPYSIRAAGAGEGGKALAQLRVKGAKQCDSRYMDTWKRGGIIGRDCVLYCGGSVQGSPICGRVAADKNTEEAGTAKMIINKVANAAHLAQQHGIAL